MSAVMRIDRLPLVSVTPDLFRGPLGNMRTVPHQAFLLAAEWTPEQVRGDGMGFEDGGPNEPP